MQYASALDNKFDDVFNTIQNLETVDPDAIENLYHYKVQENKEIDEETKAAI